MNQAENTVLYRKIEIMKNILAEILNFLPVFAIAWILQADFAGGGGEMAVFMLPGGLLLFYYFLREVSKKLSVFLLLHILPLAGLLLFYRGSVSQRIIMAAMVIIFIIMSINRRIRGSSRGMEVMPPVAAVGVFFVLYLFDGALAQGQKGAFLLEMTVVFIAFFLIHYFLVQFLYYVDMNARTNGNLAVGHIFYPAMWVAGGFTALAAGISLFGSDWELMERLAWAIRRGLTAFFTFLFSLLPKGETEQETPASMGKSSADIFDMLGEPAKESMLMKVLDIILKAAVGIAAVVFLAAAVMYALKLIRSGFGRKRKERLIAQSGYSESAERIEPKETKRRNKDRIWRRVSQTFSPEERIRRIYQKTLAESAPVWMGEKKTEILKLSTARECCAALFPGVDEAYAFARIYEKARYARGMCGKEDVKQAKILAGKLLQRNKPSQTKGEAHMISVKK